MKRYTTRIGCAVIGGIFLGATGAGAAERTVRLKVPEMVCATRALAVTSAASSVPGVISVRDDTETTTLTVVFDDAQASVGAIKDALVKVNLPADGEPEFVPQR